LGLSSLNRGQGPKVFWDHVVAASYPRWFHVISTGITVWVFGFEPCKLIVAETTRGKFFGSHLIKKDKLFSLSKEVISHQTARRIAISVKRTFNVPKSFVVCRIHVDTLER